MCLQTSADSVCLLLLTVSSNPVCQPGNLGVFVGKYLQTQVTECGSVQHRFNFKQ